jgi:hypothetical protein
LAIALYNRHRSSVQQVRAFVVTNFVISFISILFLAEDDQMAGIRAIFNSPVAFAGIFFFFLINQLKSQFRLVWLFFLSSDNKRFLKRF